MVKTICMQMLVIFLCILDMVMPQFLVVLKPILRRGARQPAHFHVISILKQCAQVKEATTTLHHTKAIYGS